MANQPESNRHVIASAYRRTLIITALVSLLVTLGVMAVLLLQNGEQAANKMVKSLETTFVHKTPNTDAWQASSEQGPSTTYVKINVHSTAGYPANLFYSTHARQFANLADKTGRQLTPAIVYVPKRGLFYYSNKSSTKARYQVWLKLDYIISQLEVVVLAVLLAVGISSILGILLMNMHASRLTQPLTNLTDAVQERTETTQPSTTPLPVPTTPLEVQQLAKSFNQLLSALNQELIHEQQFVSDASHELRTPLTVIRGYISLLKRRGAEHPEVLSEAIDFLDSESNRLQQLVESLLTITRNERLTLSPQRLELAPVLTQLLKPYQEQMTQKVQVDCPPTLSVLVDENSLKQMILALLDNAAKYSPTNQPIKITCKPQDDNVTIAVSDQGPGIPDNQKNLIFDRFYRVDAARSSQIPGTGLGLSIVSQLVSLNHGSISITDNDPRGSVFTLTLPK